LTLDVAVNSIWGADPMRFLRWSAFLLVAPIATLAAPPSVQWLWPSGASRGVSVEVQAGGSFSRWPAKLHLVGKGLTYSPGKTSGIGTLTVAPDADPGLHWLRFHDDEGASPARPFLVDLLPEVKEVEPNDDFRKAQAIPKLPVLVNGRLEKAGDVDCFAVDVKKGETLVAALEANQTLGSPMDAILQVTSASGFVLADNHDTRGLDPQIVFRVPEDGRYIVRLYAFPSEPNATIAFSGAPNYLYRLTLTTDGLAEYAWPMAVPRDQLDPVELVGWNLPTPAPRAALLPIDEEHALAWKAEVARPVTVLREAHPTVVETTPDGPRKPQRVVPPVSITGRIGTPGEADAYRFPAKKGQPLVLQALAKSLALALDPVLVVTDAEGKKLAELDDAGKNLDPVLTFTPPADGEYQVEVRDLHGHAGLRYAYVLRIAPPRPDFELSVPADAVVLAPGKPTNLVVTVDRRQGMKEAIAITAENLPPGVTAPPVACAANAKMATLVLTAKDGGVAGPFRVVGKAGELMRAARAPLAGTGLAHPHLFVVVTK
jgi:hypothetical protein